MSYSTELKIRELEKNIERIKTMQMFGRISIRDAKKKVTCINARINRHLNTLPQHEKQLYLLKREFGNYD